VPCPLAGKVLLLLLLLLLHGRSGHRAALALGRQAPL